MEVHELARPFFYPGGTTGCLLVHGFTGSPSEVRGLGRHLADAGFTVKGIRLPGHGTCPADLVPLRWPDWSRAVDEGLVALRDKCTRICLVGFSMGGALVLHCAAHHPVDGVVAINAPLYLGDPRLKYLPLLRLYRRYGMKRELTNSHWRQEHFNYDKVPLAALASMLKLIKLYHRELPQIRVPALVIQSALDRTVLPQSGETIYRQLGSEQKELVWLTNSTHMAVFGSEKELLCRKVAEFIAKIDKNKKEIGDDSTN